MSAAFRLSQIGRHGLVYTAGVVLNRVISLVMLPIYTRYLTPADYGLLQLVEMTADVIAIVFGSHLAAGIFKLYHEDDVPDRQRAVISTSLLVVALAYAAGGAAAYLLADPLAIRIFGTTEHAGLLRLAAASLALQGAILVPLSHLQLTKQSRVYVGVTSVKLLVQLTLNLVLVVGLGMAAKGVLLGTLIANALVALYLLGRLLRAVGVHFASPVARRLLRLGLPFIATQLASFVVTYGDRYFLQAAWGASVVGIYALAYQFGFLLVNLAWTPFNAVWEPARFEVARDPDRDRVYARAFTYFNLYFLVLATGIAIFVQDVLRVLAAPSFHAATPFVPIILLAYVFYSWSGFQNIGIFMKERTEFVTIANWIAAAVALALYALLIPRRGALGAAIATVAAYAVRALAIYLFSQRLWPVAYRWTPVLRLFGLSIAASVVERLLPPMALLPSVGARLVLFAAYLFAVWHSGALPASERAAIRRSIRSPGQALAFIARG